MISFKVTKMFETNSFQTDLPQHGSDVTEQDRQTNFVKEIPLFLMTLEH